MKRFAAHKLYWASRGELRSMQVVELDDTGLVTGTFPLLEEVRNTEWIGGVIVIASQKPERVAGESFADFCTRVSGREKQAASSSGFAYFITQFDVAGMGFTPASRIVGL